MKIFLAIYIEFIVSTKIVQDLEGHVILNYSDKILPKRLCEYIWNQL